jgi:hypothetical protein
MLGAGELPWQYGQSLKMSIFVGKFEILLPRFSCSGLLNHVASCYSGPIDGMQREWFLQRDMICV